MFDTADAARTALAGDFAGDELNAVLAALLPCLVFAPRANGTGAEPGGTRLGGVPDLAAGAAWPRPPAPADPEAIARRGSEAAGAEMRRHLALGLPYAFVAQVDLAEAAALGGAAADLPRHGRLLFFYDLAVGPWETGARTAHVVWDRAPREGLAPAAVPDDLAAAITAAHAEADAIRARFETPAPAHREGTVYGVPGRAMVLRPALRLPRGGTPEVEALLEAASPGRPSEDIRGRYAEALEANDPGAFGSVERQQLLGPPHPEQDDPRFDAVVVTRFGVQHLDADAWREHRDAIRAETRAWRLLLQVDLADWMRAEFTEGTVYFPIRAADLAARRFDAVVAAYQQT